MIFLKSFLKIRTKRNKIGNICILRWSDRYSACKKQDAAQQRDMPSMMQSWKKSRHTENGFDNVVNTDENGLQFTITKLSFKIVIG